MIRLGPSEEIPTILAGIHSCRTHGETWVAYCELGIERCALTGEDIGHRQQIIDAVKAEFPYFDDTRCGIIKADIRANWVRWGWFPE